MAELLIVDDDRDAADALTALLRARGHQVRWAPDAGGALAQIRHDPPDLVLLDLGLPRVFGLDLLDAMRDEPSLAPVAVAVYTGHDDPATRARAARLGACGFIAKGRPLQAIWADIETCLTRRQSGVNGPPVPAQPAVPVPDPATAQQAFAG